MLDSGHKAKCAISRLKACSDMAAMSMPENPKDLITTNDLTPVLPVQTRHTTLVTHPLYRIHSRKNSRSDIAEIARLQHAHRV